MRELCLCVLWIRDGMFAVCGLSPLSHCCDNSAVGVIAYGDGVSWHDALTYRVGWTYRVGVADGIRPMDPSDGKSK